MRMINIWAGQWSTRASVCVSASIIIVNVFRDGVNGCAVIMLNGMKALQEVRDTPCV